MAASVQVECVWRVGAGTGEGPTWSAREQAVSFVDIKGPHVHRLDARSGNTKSWVAPSPVSFIMPTVDGDFLCGLKTGLHRFDPRSGAFKFFKAVEPERPDNRLNDACVDAKGRLWFGSMDDAEQETAGYLYRLTAGGPVACDGPYLVTNGPAVSADARTLYHVDSAGQTVYAFDVADDGTLSNKRVFLRIEKEGVFPDGPVIDSEGCIWIALWGGWAVNLYDRGGRLIRSVRLPCANVTKAAFGGADLRTLYITSARGTLSPAQRERQPLAGSLFAVSVDTPGLPQPEVRDGI